MSLNNFRRVVIDDKLTYETDLDLEVGDEVRLPPLPWMTVKSWVGTVTNLRSDYDGPCKSVVSKESPDVT